MNKIMKLQKNFYKTVLNEKQLNRLLTLLLSVSILKCMNCCALMKEGKYNDVLNNLECV